MRWFSRRPTAKVLDLSKSQLPAKAKARSKRRTKAVWVAAFSVLLLCALALLSWWFFNRPKDLNNVSTIERLVRRHYVLPSGEDPTLATVTDKSKLQTPFLQHADNGDKILVYEKSGVAIIYRPKIDRIIAVGPVSVQPLKTNQ